jgi:hypothetical protein
MRRLLPFLAGVLVLATLAGLFITMRLPASITQTTTLLSYEHKGAFGYTLRLRPSSLTGTPLRLTSAYPAAVVSNIDFTFSYRQAEKVARNVYVKAVLENPGIWKKTLVLLPVTARTGDFQVSFPLDVPLVTGIFRNIEEETGLKMGSPRQITIVASVSGGGSVFTQDLLIDLSETVIEVSNDLRRSEVSGTGSLDYTVSLANAALFDTATLLPPSPGDAAGLTQKPGQTALARLLTGMDVTLEYQLTADQPLSNAAATADITAVVEASGQWSRSFPLLTGVKGGDSLNLSFPVAIADYINLIEAVKEETGVSAESCTLTIQAVIRAVADSPSGRIDEVYRPALKGMLKGNMLAWDQELVKTQPGAIKDTRLAPNPAKPSAQIIVIVLSGLSLLAVIFALLLYFMNKSRRLSRSEAAARDIAGKYGQRIARSTPQTPEPGGNVVYLESIADLVKIADELGKSVISQESGETYDYYVLDGLTRYQYSIPAEPLQPDE